MKKFLASFATSIILTASSAVAQEEQANRIAPPDVYQVAPALGAYTDDLLFGEVWKRKALAPRDRSIITVSALIANGKVAQIGGHVDRALNNGVTPDEIGEIITHLAFYSGWPNAISAVHETKNVFDQRGIDAVTDPDDAPLELDPEAETAREATVTQTVAPVSPGLAEYTNRVLFGDLWRRPELSARDRSLVTMAGLIATGQVEQLSFHANRAMDNGLTRAEAAEIPTHLAYYAGWPRAMSAVPVLRQVFDERATAGQPTAGLTVKRHDPESAVAGAPENFTGEVRIESFFQADEPARHGGAMVHFEPGARTAWHTHPLGQTLIVTSGCGWVQSEGGPVEAVQPGDVVWIPPHVRHWHGGSANGAMSHLAVVEPLDGSRVTWMKHVSDEEYAVGARAEVRCR